MGKLFKNLDITNEEDRLIGGYASVEIVDKQGDIVPIEEMEKAMMKLMDRGGYIFYGHQNKPVGKILKWEVKEHPDLGVKGVYMIAKIFNDYKIDDEVWNMVKSGKLKGFSIGGRSNKQEWAKANDAVGSKVRILKDIELGEISIVGEPANPYAIIDEVNYFAKGDMGSEVDDMEVEDYREVIAKHLIEKDGSWILVDDNGDEIAKFDDEGMGIEMIKMLSETKLGNAILSFGKEYMSDYLGFDIDIKKAMDKNVMKLMILGDTNNENLKRVIQNKIEDAKKSLEEEIEKVDERYKDGNRFKEMSCPDNPSEKSRYCGCVRAMMADGKSEESAKKICGYIARYVKKGDDLRPPKKWFSRCKESLGNDRLCGWVFYHHLKTKKPKDEKGDPITEGARRRKKKWEEERE